MTIPRADLKSSWRTTRRFPSSFPPLN
jgi:hypothetical protein